ncbi:protein PIGBOS1 [Dicentrarchus labrax]|uniref:Protein PIGBOS1 n=1 Tax=Dicentrarchus labrax TaxID=13489 RepID=A0A8P4KE41_DICLA|nr:protein PIGBOS1 [Dicentrarchus labrax]
MFRRRIPFSQIAFVTLLGVVGGIYIYRPYFDTALKTSAQQNVPKKPSETDNSS